ncbi:MAG: GTPase, partial [Nanoarchaeota archaeon]
EELSPFYNELARVTIRYNLTKQALGSVKWAEKQCREVSWKVVIAIKRARSMDEIEKQKKAYFGRICSVMKQIQKHLVIIEESRRVLKSWPDVKEGVRTIAIAGYPNVGKSSLLKALTQTNPEIKAYAFTTKSLNIGYLEIEPRIYQIIDTPGTFDREIEKMNNVEKQAYVVMKHAAEKILYMFDPSESCGYEVESQLQLLKRIEKNFNKEITVIVNKVDLDTTKLSKIKKEYPHAIEISVKTRKGIEEVKNTIVKNTIRKETVRK